MTKLIALKDISGQLKEGQEFELDERGARMLVALKVAAVVVEDEESATAPSSRRTYRRRDLQAQGT